MPQHAQGIFITGTDTHVGKTVVTACMASLALKNGLNVCVYKPIQTGCAEEEKTDPQQVQYWVKETLPVYCSYQFDPPVTPMVADVNHTIKLTRLEEDFKALSAQYDLVLVEGAGGICVPITPYLQMVDLIRRFNIPTMVVARSTLGTINHTLLTVTTLIKEGISVAGVVVSSASSEPDNTQHPAVSSLKAVFDQVLPVPVISWLPFMALEQSLSLAPEHSIWQTLTFNALPFKVETAVPEQRALCSPL